MINHVFLGLAGFALLSGTAFAGEGFDQAACTYNGHPLFGAVQVVESFPDITVQVVESFPDLKVKLVDSFADDCGEWKMVESFPDVKIQYVESFADVKIKVVTSFPGWP